MAEEAIQTELLGRIAQEDRNALEEFYGQSAGILYSIAVRILEDTHEAEEVTQDVFVQIWEKASLFDGTLGSPMSWAAGMTRNRCIDRLRSRERRSRLASEFADEVKTVTEAPVAAEGQLADTEREAVRAAVLSLPPEQRQALEMAFFGGLTHHEIAEALNQPLGTIKARIRRGMLKLRESLKTYA
jgi:RNA polymerase sigma-70 factor (ECF subfamily)